MNLYFDRLHGWGHRKTGKTFMWGIRETAVVRSPYTSNAVPYKVRRDGNRVGPLVGILTSRKGTTFAGNRQTFRRIHGALQQRGGIMFVFTLNDVKADTITGAVFHPSTRRWVKTGFPLPDVVYNRIPFRKAEAAPAVKSFLQRCRTLHIPYFNTGFLDKWEMDQWLRMDPNLVPHLPATRRLRAKEDLQTALDDWGSLYAKPKAGQKGDGIWRVSVQPDGSLDCRSHEESFHFASVNELWHAVRKILGKSPYLLQEKIDLHEHHGRPYDFRLMLQKVQNEWKCTGIGVRAAGQHSITTHVPKGGKLLSLGELQPPADRVHMTQICKRAARQLESRLHPLNELSFDIGRDQNGNHWLFEANAKPMVFDEPKIEEKRMKRLVDTLYVKSGF